jgi:hypothetical protein
MQLGDRYFVAHWRVELMDSKLADFCASWLHNASTRARSKWGMEASVMVLMTDAPSISLCARGLSCQGWNPGVEFAKGTYHDPLVRRAQAWLRTMGWRRTDELWAEKKPSSLLATSNLARFLTDREIALQATVFVSCQQEKCTKCSYSGRSGGNIVDERQQLKRPNQDWQ